MPIQPNRRVSHRSIDIQENSPPLVRRRNSQVLPIPSDAPPRQLASIAGILLLERPFNSPVMRQVEQSPLPVIKAALRERYAPARIALRLGLELGFHIRGEGGAGGIHPLLDCRITQFPRRVRRVPFLEAPPRVQRETLCRRNRLRARPQRRHTHRHQRRQPPQKRHIVGKEVFSHALLVSRSPANCPLRIFPRHITPSEKSTMPTGSTTST